MDDDAEAELVPAVVAEAEGASLDSRARSVASAPSPCTSPLTPAGIPLGKKKRNEFHHMREKKK